MFIKLKCVFYNEKCGYVFEGMCMPKWMICWRSWLRLRMLKGMCMPSGWCFMPRAWLWMLTIFHDYVWSMVKHAREVSLLWLCSWWFMMMPAMCWGSSMLLLVYDDVGSVLRFKNVIIGFMIGWFNGMCHPSLLYVPPWLAVCASCLWCVPYGLNG